MRRPAARWRSLAACALCLTACGGGSQPAGAPPDIVLVVIDTLRRDHLGLYGYPVETAPFLASLAQTGVVFDDAVSTSSWTAPATASLFTALHPLRHGLWVGVNAQRDRMRRREGGGGSLELSGMPRGVATLPELLRERGYRTYGVSANVNVASALGFARGFDRFAHLEQRPAPDPGIPTFPPGVHSPFGDAARVEAQLRAWEPELRAPGPLFLYLHFNDPHTPYHARDPAGWQGPLPADRDELIARVVAAYDSEIAHVDAALGRIYAHLGLEDAVLAVLSDHGEGFGEHGRFYHNEGLYAELNRIVYLVHAPVAGVSARRVEERVTLMSVAPTLLELAGLDAPKDRDGPSLAPLLRGGPGAQPLAAELAERVVVAHRVAWRPTDPTAWAVLQGPWKLLREGERTELYDVRADPSELRDLAPAEPEVAARLAAELDAFRTRASPPPPETVELELDPGDIEGLRALGYAD